MQGDFSPPFLQPLLAPDYKIVMQDLSKQWAQARMGQESTAEHIRDLAARQQAGHETLRLQEGFH